MAPGGTADRRREGPTSGRARASASRAASFAALSSIRRPRSLRHGKWSTTGSVAASSATGGGGRCGSTGGRRERGSWRFLRTQGGHLRQGAVWPRRSRRTAPGPRPAPPPAATAAAAGFSGQASPRRSADRRRLRDARGRILSPHRGGFDRRRGRRDAGPDGTETRRAARGTRLQWPPRFLAFLGRIPADHPGPALNFCGPLPCLSEIRYIGLPAPSTVVRANLRLSEATAPAGCRGAPVLGFDRYNANAGDRSHPADRSTTSPGTEGRVSDSPTTKSVGRRPMVLHWHPAQRTSRIPAPGRRKLLFQGRDGGVGHGLCPGIGRSGTASLRRRPRHGNLRRPPYAPAGYALRPARPSAAPEPEAAPRRQNRGSRRRWRRAGDRDGGRHGPR